MTPSERVDEQAKRLHRAGLPIEVTSICNATGLGRGVVSRALRELKYQPDGERRARRWLPPATEVTP